MRFLLLVLACTCAIASRVQAQSGTATFACPAQRGDTCFFVVFGPNFQTVPFELRGGDSKVISGVVVGRDSYCYKVNQPVPSNCPKTPVSGQVNK